MENNVESTKENNVEVNKKRNFAKIALKIVGSLVAAAISLLVGMEVTGVLFYVIVAILTSCLCASFLGFYYYWSTRFEDIETDLARTLLFVLIFSATALLLIGTGRYIISDAFVVNLFAKIIEIVIIVAPFAVGFCLVAELAYFEVFIERDKPKYATRMIILTAITVIALIGCFYGWSTL